MLSSTQRFAELIYFRFPALQNRNGQGIELILTELRNYIKPEYSLLLFEARFADLRLNGSHVFGDQGFEGHFHGWKL